MTGVPLASASRPHYQRFQLDEGKTNKSAAQYISANSSPFKYPVNNTFLGASFSNSSLKGPSPTHTHWISLSISGGIELATSKVF